MGLCCSEDKALRTLLLYKFSCPVGASKATTACTFSVEGPKPQRAPKPADSLLFSHTFTSFGLDSQKVRVGRAREECWERNRGEKGGEERALLQPVCTLHRNRTGSTMSAPARNIFHALPHLSFRQCQDT